jgi:hypothetical protein
MMLKLLLTAFVGGGFDPFFPIDAEERMKQPK